MFDKIKKTIQAIWDGGQKAIDKISTGYDPDRQPDPVAFQATSQRFQQYVMSQPLQADQSKLAEIQERNKFSPNNLQFKSPFISDLAKDPRYSNPSQPLDERFSAYITPKINRAKSIVEGVGNGIADWTYRGILTRPVAQGVMSVADAVTPGDFPSFTATDPGGKLLFGDQPLTSYQQSTKNAQGWLKDEAGLPEGFSNNLGLMAGVANVALDLPGGSLLKKPVKEVAESIIKNNIDDVAEMAWKNTSAKDKLKTLLTYKDKLLKSGWTAEAVEKMSAKDANVVIKNGVTLKDWLQTQAETITNTPLWASFKEKFVDWVGDRQASKFKGIVATDDFKRLDELGSQAFNLIESGEHKKVFQSLREVLDAQWQKLNEAGIKTGYIENYLPHLFKETQSEAEIALGRRITKSSKFSLTRILKDYNDGLSAGLTPQYNKLSDVVGAYVMSTEKSVADKGFYDWLRANKVILTPSEINKLPKEMKNRFSNWVAINSDHFGFSKLNEVYKADPDIAGTIDNFLMDYGSNPSKRFGLVERALKAGAGLNTQLKNWKLSAGVPGTGINSFGLMSVRRHMYAGQNPIKNLMEGVKWMLNPSSADEVLQAGMKDTPDAVKHGLVLSVEDHEFFAPAVKEYKNILTKSYGVVADKLSNWFEKPLFGKILPAMKLKTYRQNVEIFLKQGLDSTSAKELSAKVTNDIYGGLNLDRMMRDKGTQTLLRNAFLAPDLYESQINVGKGLVNMFSKNSPEAKIYQLYTRNLVMDLINRNVVNKVLSGHFMFENSTGNKFNIDTGSYQDDGTKRYIKGYGNDVVKIPFDIIDGTIHGDPEVMVRTVRNRLSMVAGTALGIATNTNFAGNKLYYPDDTPIEKGLAIGNEALGLALPSQVTAVGRYALGKQGLEQTATQLAELPVYYREGPYSKAEKESTKLMQQGGMTGEEINQSRNDTRDIKYSKLTEAEQLKNIKAGLPADTQRNWLGMPKKGQSSMEPRQDNGLEGSEESGNVGWAGKLINETKTSKLQADKEKVIKAIYESLETEDQINKALDANGISSEEATFYMLGTLGVENGQRGEVIQSMLKETKSEEEFTKTALSLAKESLLTTGVTAQWLKDGVITESQKKFYDNLIKQGKGEKVGSGSVSVKTAPYPSISVPKMSPKASAKLPSMKSLGADSRKPFEIAKIKQGSKLPTMAEMKSAMAKLESMPEVKFSSVPR